MNRFYRVVHAVARPVVRLLFPWTVTGLENVTGTEEKLVLCPNHPSAWDPVLICLALPGDFPISIMAKKELIDIPVIGKIIEKLGAFGVDRGHSDLNAVRKAIKTVRDGNALLLFPEGTRSLYEGQVRPKGGVTMIAMRTGAVMLPVYVGGKKRIFHRTNIIFGTPYRPTTATRHGTAEEYQSFADEIVRRAYALGKGEK